MGILNQDPESYSIKLKIELFINVPPRELKFQKKLQCEKTSMDVIQWYNLRNLFLNIDYELGLVHCRKRNLSLGCAFLQLDKFMPTVATAVIKSPEVNR